VRTTVVDPAPGEQRGHEAEALVEHRRPNAVVDLVTEAGELPAARVEAQPRTEHEPSPREHVESGDLARQDVRSAAGDRRHLGPKRTVEVAIAMQAIAVHGSVTERTGDR